MSADWLELLRAAVARDARGISGVAELLGYSRPAISRALAGTYGNTEHLQRAVLAGLARVDCPFLCASLAPQECAGYASRSYGGITAADVPHWRACRKCPLNPTNPNLNPEKVQ